MELQKAQEARQARKTDGAATTGATRPHERPATASTIPKPSAEKTQEVKRPATATTSKTNEPVKTTVIKERPLSSGTSDRKTSQPTQPVHRQNVEKVVSVSYTHLYYYPDCETMTDVAYYYIDELQALGDIPPSLQNYIDYEAYGRDLDMGGCFIETSRGICEIPY